jgi:hypothetical protein
MSKFRVGCRFGILFIGIFLLMIIGVSAINIGYVVKSESSPTSNELFIKNLLTNKGYEVEMFEESFNADSYDAIIVSDSIDNIEGIFNNLNHKTLFLSGQAAKETGLGVQHGITQVKKVQINNVQNIITEEYNRDDYEIYDPQSYLGYIFNCLGQGSTSLISKTGNLGKSVLLVFEENSLLIDTTISNPNCNDRNVLLNEKNLFLGFHSSEKWNEEGENLFFKSLDWLVGGEDIDGDGYSSLVDCDDNDASIHPDAVELDKNCVNDKPVLTTIPDIGWIKNGNYELDLDNYFEDPEGDNLEFNVFASSDDDEIIVNLDGGVVSFSSPADWIGEGWISFRARDGEKFEVSNKIALRVYEEGGENTCSLLNGFICSTGQTCSGNWLSVIDSSRCCSVSCLGDYDFSDINRQDNLNSQLKINIENIEDGNEFVIGNTIDVEVEIENTGSEDLDLEIFVYLYDLTDNEIVEEISNDEGVNDGKTELFEFELKVPNDIDEGNDYAIFVKAEDVDYYNEDFVLIEIHRKDSDLKINDVVLSKESLECGDYLEIRVKAENWGVNEKEGYIQIENSKLKINEKSEMFSLEGYDDGVDDIWEMFSVQIPKGVSGEEYILEIGVYYGLKSHSIDKSIQVSCKNGVEEEQEVINLGEPNGVQVVKESNKEVLVVWGILSFCALLVMFSVLRVWKKFMK